MNLFYSHSLTQLSTLIGKCTNSRNYYYLLVEHDGEVTIECSSKELKERLHKYKFYISGLHGKFYTGANAANNLLYLNQLYKNLLYCWENYLSGPINYSKISSIQLINYWLEVNDIAQISIEPENVSVIIH
jgi:hypothetical protein